MSNLPDQLHVECNLKTNTAVGNQGKFITLKIDGIDRPIKKIEFDRDEEKKETMLNLVYDHLAATP